MMMRGCGAGVVCGGIGERLKAVHMALCLAGVTSRDGGECGVEVPRCIVVSCGVKCFDVPRRGCIAAAAAAAVVVVVVVVVATCCELCLAVQGCCETERLRWPSWLTGVVQARAMCWTCVAWALRRRGLRVRLWRRRGRASRVVWCCCIRTGWTGV
jgi:hypothetical protein